MATNDGTKMNLEHTHIPLPDEADGGDWLTVKYGWKKTSTPTNPPLQPRHPSVSRVERLPPLPRNDLKVIIRPREGLNLPTWTTPQVAEGIKMACQHPTTEPVRTLTVRIDPVQNIAIASTPNEALAMSIRHINTIHLGGREFAVTAYVAAPDSSAKAVIHGIPAGTPTEVLLNGLYAPGREILHARMLGQTSAAVITFTGKTVPFYVRYYSGEVRCKPYRPTTHVCRICYQVGHRTDCGTQNPTQDHPCHPRCALCQGSHPTASKECPDRLKKTPLASQRTSRHEHSRSSDGSVPAPGLAPVRGTNRERPGTPADLLRRDHKRYVYVARNPWDVCVSLFHMVTNLSVYRFEDGTFDEFFEYFLKKDFGYGSYFDHVATGYALRDRPNVLFLTYEQLKRETRETVLKLARFLGDRHGRLIEDDENGLLDQILEQSSPSRMKSVVVMNLRSQEWEVMMTRNNMTCKNGYDGDCKKYGIVRNAQIGDWKNYFKPDQLQRLEAKIRAEGEKASFMNLWADIRKEALEVACS
ncbi:hypothetical protein HPB49_013609 [Dermacentor silvarum]|uniref:Uncharacterized protein n=1 Tax=Dermacentor silvarum TaxID=543639 RepID=A0ACB8D5Y4_DERSI|nr:hypothetical protein HPB49_013609 [Dermacentor silvarum]